jgi:hypothetical protein
LRQSGGSPKSLNILAKLPRFHSRRISHVSKDETTTQKSVFPLETRRKKAYLGSMLKDPKETVQEMVSLVGKRETRRLLTIAGVSTSVADKLSRNKYEPEIGPLIGAAIARARKAAKKTQRSA